MELNLEWEGKGKKKTKKQKNPQTLRKYRREGGKSTQTLSFHNDAKENKILIPKTASIHTSRAPIHHCFSPPLRQTPTPLTSLRLLY